MTNRLNVDLLTNVIINLIDKNAVIKEIKDETSISIKLKLFLDSSKKSGKTNASEASIIGIDKSIE